MHYSKPRALTAAICLGFLVSAEAQITFTIPADAPDGGVGTVGILEVTANGGQGDQGNARTSLQSVTGTRKTGSSNFVDYFSTDAAARAHFTNDLPFLSDPTPLPNNGVSDDINDIAVLYRGTINIPSTGAYTFGINSDDGFTLAFDNGTSPFTAVTQANGAILDTYNGTPLGAFTHFGGRGANDSLASITLTAGSHPFILTYHEGGGGAGNEFIAAAGVKSSFDSSFNLVGGPAIPSVIRPTQLVTVGTWDYVRLNGTTGTATTGTSTSLAAAITQYNNNVPSGTVGTNFTRSGQATVNFHDPQGSNTGGHTPVKDFPDNVGSDENNFGGAGRVTLTLAPGDVGHYSFLVYGDDSIRFRIANSTGTLLPILSFGGGAGNGQVDSGTSLTDNTLDTVMDAFQTTGCCSDAYGTYDLATAGVYTLEAVFNEQGGGAGFFVYGGKGDLTTFSNAYQLVGENLNNPGTTPVAAGLQLVPEPSSMLIGILGGAGMLGLRRRRK